MSKIFSGIYSEVYDLIYQDKNYESECNLIEDIFRKYSKRPVQSILDLGCGTGNHAIPLAKRGYKVTGVDLSESMLEHARVKVENSKEKKLLKFIQGDIRSINLKQKFDAAIMMFAVLGYQLENSDVFSTLKCVRKHLKKDSLFIFDVWYGPAVLREKPSQKIKILSNSKGRVLRVASGELDIMKHLCTVHYLVWQLEKNKIVQEIEEHHTMRFFFLKELEFFLQVSGLEIIHWGAFPQFKSKTSESTWNIIGVAKAI